MDAAAEPFGGKVPDHVFSCTGGAAGILGYFIELTPDQLKQSVDVNYWTAVWTARVKSLDSNISSSQLEANRILMLRLILRQQLDGWLSRAFVDRLY
jgi:hypothetical protein